MKIDLLDIIDYQAFTYGFHDGRQWGTENFGYNNPYGNTHKGRSYNRGWNEAKDKEREREGSRQREIDGE